MIKVSVNGIAMIGKKGIGFILSLVQVSSTIITWIDHITIPQHATKSHSKATNSGELTKRLW